LVARNIGKEWVMLWVMLLWVLLLWVLLLWVLLWLTQFLRS
jgi:hypothetical protein